MPSVNELRTGVAGLGGPVPKRVHLIGVAGSGMSGLAGLLLALGHRVSGSDKVDTAEVRRLQGEGLIYHGPHSAELVRDADVVIYSSAVKKGNAAFDEAVRLERCSFAARKRWRN